MILSGTVLYKYGKAHYLYELLEYSHIRIGTLSSFRSEESLGSQIGDRDEGTKTISKWIPEPLDISNPSNRSPLVDKVIHVAPGLKGVTISNLTGLFANALTQCLKKLGIIRGKWIIAPCQYISRHLEESDPKTTVHPALIKDPKYQDQKEVRILWWPVEENINPVTVKCDAAARCCKLVNNSRL